MTRNANSRIASVRRAKAAPNTGAAPRPATVIASRMYPDQRAALDRGEGATLFVKQYPVEVVDFYGKPAC